MNRQSLRMTVRYYEPHPKLNKILFYTPVLLCFYRFTNINYFKVLSTYTSYMIRRMNIHTNLQRHYFSVQGQITPLGSYFGTFGSTPTTASFIFFFFNCLKKIDGIID